MSNHSCKDTRGNPRRRYRRHRDDQRPENENGSLTGAGAFALLLLIIAGWSYIESLLLLIFCLLLASPLIALSVGLYLWYSDSRKFSVKRRHIAAESKDETDDENKIVEFPRR